MKNCILIITDQTTIQSTILPMVTALSMSKDETKIFDTNALLTVIETEIVKQKTIKPVK